MLGDADHMQQRADRQERRAHYRAHPVQGMLVLLAYLALFVGGLALVLGLAWRLLRLVAGV